MIFWKDIIHSGRTYRPTYKDSGRTWQQLEMVAQDRGLWRTCGCPMPLRAYDISMHIGSNRHAEGEEVEVGEYINK